MYTLMAIKVLWGGPSLDPIIGRRKAGTSEQRGGLHCGTAVVKFAILHSCSIVKYLLNVLKEGTLHMGLIVTPCFYFIFFLHVLKLLQHHLCPDHD